MTGRTHILKGFSWLLGEKVVGAGTTFLSMIVVARYYGPADFGTLSFALSLTSLFAVAGNFGLNGLVVKECLDRSDSWRSVLATAFVLKLIGYAVAMVIVIGMAFTTPNLTAYDRWVVIFMAVSLLPRPYEVLDYWLQGCHNFRDAAIARTVTQVFGSILRAALSFLMIPMPWIAGTFILQYAGLAIAYLVIVRRYAPSALAITNYSKVLAKDLTGRGVFLFVGAILATVNLKIDQVMINAMLGKTHVGHYAVAASISEAWYFFPVALTSVVFPYLIKGRASSQERFHRQMQLLTDLLFTTALIAAIVVTFYANEIIDLLYGPQYDAAAEILTVHIWSAIFIFMRTAFSKWILIEGALKFSMLTHGLGALANVGLNYFLIPKFGVVGAAYATLISYAMSSYIVLLLHKNMWPVFKMMTRSMLLPLRIPDVLANIAEQRKA